MFLDDELYAKLNELDKIIENKLAQENAKTIERVFASLKFNELLINPLLEIAEKRWKDVIRNQKQGDTGHMGRSQAQEVITTIERTFNSYDLFIQRLKKENHKYYSLIEKYSYRKMFMENETLRNIYNDWKTKLKNSR